MEKKVLINEQIKAEFVLVIDENGVNLGKISYKDAMETAKARDLDLILVSQQEVPVCKLGEWSKINYQMQKKQKKQKKNSKPVTLKQIQLGIESDNHDISYRIKQAKDFLEEGHKVSFFMRLRRKQIPKASDGVQIMKKVATELDVEIEKEPALEGARIIMIIRKKAKKNVKNITNE